MIFYKEMKKLYRNRYRNRIVLKLEGAHLFRGGHLNQIRTKIYDYTANPELYFFKITDTTVLLNIVDDLEPLDDFAVRIEGCWLSIYVNDDQFISHLINNYKDHIKTVYTPPVSLTQGTIVSTLPYDYKVHIRVKNTIDYSGFLEWAKNNDKLRITNSTKDAMKYLDYYATTYFYITGDSSLTLARLHLGASIHRIEKIIHS